MSIINLNYLKNFLESKYSRQLIFKTNNVEIILMCWLPGQGTEIHGHGESDAVTLVLEGEMSYTTYYPDKTKVSGILKNGDIEHIPVGVDHQAVNKSDKNLITLHIYSPPLESSLLPCTLGYSNDVKLKQVQLDEKVVSYLMADKSLNINESDSAIKCLENTSKKQKYTVAIVGGGFSGALTAVNLLSMRVDYPVQIFLIERAPRFARGFAYSTNSPMHLLNVPAGKMSALPDKPEHFLNWAKERNSEINEKTFVPRMLYGEYLESVLHDAILNKSENISFKRLNDEATDLKLNSNNSAEIHLDSGIVLNADKVVLAVGNYPPKNPNVAQPSFYKSKRYIRDPWSAKSLTQISPEDPILMIGTGLTMIDKAVELKVRGHRGKIYAISRHGFIPQAHDLNIKNVNVDIEDILKENKLTAIFKKIREKIKLASKSGSDWRFVLDALRPHIQSLWLKLSEKEKKTFFRHLRPYWDMHRHRIPTNVFSVIKEMLDQDQLEVFSGRVVDYTEHSDSVTVIFKDRKSSKPLSIEVAKVINCTGSEMDFCQIEDPLITNLLKRGLISSDKLSLGLDATESGALKDSSGNVSNLLYTLGPPLKGLLWETTAVPEIRQQAKNLSNKLIPVLETSK